MDFYKEKLMWYSNLFCCDHSGKQWSKAEAALLMTYCNGPRAEPWLWSVWWQLHAVSSTQSPPPSPLSGQVKRISVKWCCSASMFHIINNQFGHKFIVSGEFLTLSPKKKTQNQPSIMELTSFMLPSRLEFLLMPWCCPAPGSPAAPCLCRLAMFRGRVQ